MTDIYPPHPSPLPQGGEGEREPIFVLFKTCVRLEREPTCVLFKTCVRLEREPTCVLFKT